MKQATAANRPHDLPGRYRPALAPLLFLLVAFATLAGMAAPVYAQTISISDISQSEGDSGTTYFEFRVTYNGPPLASDVTFGLDTSSGTATEDVDYEAFHIPPVLTMGSPSDGSYFPFSVSVTADTTYEPDEFFYINITGATGAAVLDGQGLGTILNDDPPPPLVQIDPPDGATLMAGVVGVSYSDTSIQAQFGTGSNAFYAINMPPGLGIDIVSGAITGTPSAAGTFNPTVTLVDTGYGGSAVVANYTITIAPTPAITVVSPASGSTAGGTTISISGTGLTGTSAVVVGGAAATGIAVVSDTLVTAITPAHAAGPADVSVTTPGGTTTLPAVFTYIAPLRPDPTQDAEVQGLINAQAQAAERFATTQIDNFNDRLGQLHDEQSRQAQSLGIQMGVTPGNGVAPMGYVEQAPVDDPAGRAMGLPPAGSPALPVEPLFSDTAFWSGGFINFGTTSSGTIDLGHTLVGVSGGVDHRFTPDFVAGIGFGYGRDRTDIGSNGTTSSGQAVSAAVYGSYHPAPFYLDGLIGISRLDFDSTRYVTATGGFAYGNRDGTQLFASLSAGYEYRQDGLVVSPYGRLDAAVTRLDGFVETGAGANNLAFGAQGFDMLAGIVGVSAQYAIPMEWGVLSPRARLEYTHDFAGSSQASIGYADLGTLPYTLTLDDVLHDYLTLGFGLDARFDADMTLSLDYRTGLSTNGNGRNHTIGIRLSGGF
ncbi:autotransporter domain-containing protein [Devosia ginsengisoli]|uniref:Autotransporter domain-containing protein n=1 Tax=Devosia ginsengisoli TaxID=400770 RepID=A0A5B8LR30_9HYPH|nr:autotransporter domain-containing protein [Devosia ginsengisoli]QDZ10154.1 autotransporter domain-containing protein [Devosia ginsengisoli]